MIVPKCLYNKGQEGEKDCRYQELFFESLPIYRQKQTKTLKDKY